MKDEEKWARYLLGRVSGIGSKTFINLLHKFKSAQNILDQSVVELAQLIGEKPAKSLSEFRQGFDLDREIQSLKQRDINIVVYGEEDYPKILQSISDPPAYLYWRGKYDANDFSRTIAIVGSRKMSEYGKSMTYRITNNLAQKGFIIVSGLAFGIDAQAHRTALESNSKTIAVLASSVDTPTPYGNVRLYEEILKKNGLIVSETHPDDQIAAGSFPKRNRVLAGLSLATVVIEAAESSGSLITAELAFGEGRQVFAVPGDVGRSLSVGTNNLIKNSKAKLVQDADDILEELGYVLASPKHKSTTESELADPIQKSIIQTLRIESMTSEAIAKILSLDISSTLTAISMLELDGHIVRADEGKYRLVV